MATSVTEQQILDAINAARKHDDSNPHGALTCKEIAKISGMTRGWANRKITELVESGVLKITKVCKTRVDGTRCWLPAYFVSQKDTV